MSDSNQGRAAGPGPDWPLSLRLYVALLRRLRRWLRVNVFIIYRRSLTAGIEIPPEMLDRYRFCELTEAELLEQAADPALELPPEKVRAAAARGDIFFGVYHGPDLVAYRWYSVSGSVPCENGMEFLFAHPARAYGYRTFTRRDHRGRRLHLYSTRDSDTRLAEKGITHTVGYIAAHNVPSLRSNARLPGVERIGAIVTCRIGSKLRTLRSPGAARQGIDMTVAPH